MEEVGIPNSHHWTGKFLLRDVKPPSAGMTILRPPHAGLSTSSQGDGSNILPATDVGVPHKRQVPSPPLLDYITILNLKRTPWNDRRSPRAQEVPRIIPFDKYVRNEVSSHNYGNY